MELFKDGNKKIADLPEIIEHLKSMGWAEKTQPKKKREETE